MNQIKENLKQQNDDDLLDGRFVSAFEGKSIDEWGQTELLHSKSNLQDVEWGKQVIRAIDLDDCVKLSQLMDTKNYPLSNINCQTTTMGYSGYLWTVKIHEHLGDTALHRALYQKKLYCVYMLLFLQADPLLLNEKGVTSALLCQQIFSTSYQNMKYDAKRKIIDKISPIQWKLLPSSFECQTVENEAWKLMKLGKICYSEFPNALKNHQKNIPKTMIQSNTRKHLSFNTSESLKKNLKNHLEKNKNDIFDFHEKSLKKSSKKLGNNNNNNNNTANISPENTVNNNNHNQAVSRPSSKWLKLQTNTGEVYYYHQVRSIIRPTYSTHYNNNNYYSYIYDI
jgi:hypothetical protein